jgi:hypothetical protein
MDDNGRMKHAAWLLPLACALGCQRPPPPNVIAVDPNLPAEVAEAALLARDAWCEVSDRTGWCPEVIVGLRGDAVVRADHWDSEVTAEDAGGYAHNDGTLVGVSINALQVGFDVATWELALRHEFGHFGIYAPAHSDESALMAWFHNLEDARPSGVDPKAVEMWCDQQGC